MSNSKTFGQRLRELRLAKKLSQRELAKRVAARLREEDRRGFDFTYLSKIENDRLPPPSVLAIVQLAAELDADSDELLALGGKAPPDVGEAFKKSAGARAFFRSAINLNLSEEEWKRLLENLEKNRSGKDRRLI
jgi:transcriptional regulator with XRE-family HTH domain